MIDQSHPANPKARLHPWPPQTGEWVKFKSKDPLPPHAHVCPEGYYVGIYVRQGTDPYGNEIKEHVAPVDKFGENIYPLPRVVSGLEEITPAFRPAYELQPKAKPEDPNVYVLRSGFVHVQLDPTTLVELHHAEDILHLPSYRINKTLKDDPTHQLPAWHRRQKALTQTINKTA